MVAHSLQVLEHYCIPEYKDVQEFLSHLANKTGKLKKGGIPDTETAARSVLRDWNMLVPATPVHKSNYELTPVICFHIVGVALNFTPTPLRSGPYLATCRRTL